MTKRGPNVVDLLASGIGEIALRRIVIELKRCRIVITWGQDVTQEHGGGALPSLSYCNAADIAVEERRV